MVRKCDKCGNDFETKRNDAKYCSPKCRKISSRAGLSVTDNQLSAANVTDNIVSSVTDNQEHRDAKIRAWLEQQFKDEGKTPDEITGIMNAQDDYYLTLGYYFIPARMTEQAHISICI